MYRGILIANGGFNTKTAEEGVNNAVFDLVSFGRLPVNNPDLPERH